MTDDATPADLLAAAQASLHRLMTGEAEAQVRTADGRQVTFHAPDVRRLEAYIADLQRQVDGRRYRPIAVRF